MRKCEVKKANIDYCKIKGYSIIMVKGKYYLVDAMTGFSGGNIKFITYLYPRLATELKSYDSKKKSKNTRPVMSGYTQVLIVIAAMGIQKTNIFNDANIDRFIIPTDNNISLIIIALSIFIVFLISKYIKKTRQKRISNSLEEKIRFDLEISFEMSGKSRNKTKKTMVLFYVFLFIFYIMSICMFMVLDNYLFITAIVLISCFLFFPLGNIANGSMEVCIKKVT